MCMGQIFSNVHLSHCMLHPGRINIAYKAQNQTHQLHNPVPMTCFVHKVLQHFSHTQAERITYSYRALSQFCCTRVCSTQSGLCTHIEHETQKTRTCVNLRAQVCKCVCKFADWPWPTYTLHKAQGSIQFTLHMQLQTLVHTQAHTQGATNQGSTSCPGIGKLTRFATP